MAFRAWVIVLLCTRLAYGSPASSIPNGFYQPGVEKRDVAPSTPARPPTLLPVSAPRQGDSNSTPGSATPTAALKSSTPKYDPSKKASAPQRKARGENWDNQGVEPFPGFVADGLQAVAPDLVPAAAYDPGMEAAQPVYGDGGLPGADGQPFYTADQPPALDSQPYLTGESFNGQPDFSQAFDRTAETLIMPTDALQEYNQPVPQDGGVCLEPINDPFRVPDPSMVYHRSPDTFGQGLGMKDEFGRELKYLGPFNRDYAYNDTLERDLEYMESLLMDPGPNPFYPEKKPEIHYNMPVELPCKGNCPLKNNLLPKYDPDDGGKLKCPEDDGKHFRAATNALFEIVCYADFLGRELRSETETSLDACINTCTRVQQCRAVVFTPKDIDGPCVLKFHEGRSHINPFVMSARLVASNCASGMSNSACERHNKVWEQEQEEARQERHKMHIAETRSRIETLRKERAGLEAQRHQNRLLRYQHKMLKEGIDHASERDRARYEAYAQSEEEFRRKKLHEQKEAQRDREREQRRFNWKIAVEERERERLRHQVEREREALEAEMDKLREHEWSGDEAWWTAGRHEQVHGAGKYEISPAAAAAGFHNYVPDKAGECGGDAKCLGEKCLGAEFAAGGASAAGVAAGVPTTGGGAAGGAGGYPVDDDWRWYPDKSWQGYWDIEGAEREMYEGWTSEDEAASLRAAAQAAAGVPPRRGGGAPGDDWKQLEIDVSRIRGIEDPAHRLPLQ